MKLSERSLKAKEKFADSSMFVANSIASAVFIGILVFPLTAFVSTFALGNEPFAFIKAPTWGQVLLFGGLYFSPLIAARCAKEKAMDLYDEIDNITPNSSIERTRSKLRMLRSTHINNQ